jgi:glycosyltransferase involved in cell wall biosynthesis
VDISIVIPTYQRASLVLSTVRALDNQAYPGAFEVIVVVDGSADNSAAALRALTTRFPLTVIEQPNRGIAAARNRGAAAARGDLLLFLDDDMEADSHLLSEHVRSHLAGADAVTGHVPLHPASPQNFLSASVKAWADDRAKALAASPEADHFLEIVGGQLSISRRLFNEFNGFDLEFTRDGTFGNEDRDLACRLLDRGHRIVFNPDAISWQTYVVTPRDFLNRYRQAGSADVRLALKHSARSAHIFNADCAESRRDRILWRWLRVPIRWMALAAVALGSGARWQADLFFFAWKLEYLQGVRDGRRPRRRNAQMSRNMRSTSS